MELKRDQILVLVAKDFKLKYNSTALGFAWSLIVPIFTSLIYFFVFGVVMRWRAEHYLLYLVSGNFMWQFFANVVLANGRVLMGNSTLLKKTSFDRGLLIWGTFFTESIHFLLTIPVLVVIMLCYGVVPQWATVVPNLALAFVCLTLLAEFIANDQPLLVKYKDKFYFPVFKTYTEQEFGGDFPTPADYRDSFIADNINRNGYIIFPPLPYSFNTVDYDLETPTPSAPAKNHLLGTDDEGRDILSRIIYGLRISVIFAFLLTALSSVLGIIAGAIQGYFGGKIDIIMQRFLEIWEALPQLFVLIIIASIFVPSFWTLLIIMLCFNWMSLVGVVRAEFLRTRNFDFVKAAKALGVGNGRIIFRHILPNAVIATITYIPFLLSEAIVALTALDFLGLGLSHDYPSLGDLVRQGKDNLQAPWIGISIFIVLSGLLTLLIFIGEGIRDAFDTRKAE